MPPIGSGSHDRHWVTVVYSTLETLILRVPV